MNETNSDNGESIETDLSDEKIQNKKEIVWRSDVRKEVLFDLDKHGVDRPSNILKRIQDRVETSDGNFYNNLRALREGDIIERKSQENKRASRYELTPIGETIVKKLKEEVDTHSPATPTGGGPPDGGTVVGGDVADGLAGRIEGGGPVFSNINEQFERMKEEDDGEFLKEVTSKVNEIALNTEATYEDIAVVSAKLAEET